MITLDSNLFGKSIQMQQTNNEENKVIAIEDRREAIIQESLMLEKNDCLVVLGKGHEDTQEINGSKIYFSDHEVINEIYK